VGLAALAVLALEGGAQRNARQRAVEATAASAKRQMKAAKDSLDQNCPMEKKGGWSLLLLQPCRFSSERAKPAQSIAPSHLLSPGNSDEHHATTTTKRPDYGWTAPAEAL
jgi:hypothetical protein